MAMVNRMNMFHGTTTSGWKGMDPFYFFMNPIPTYEAQFLSKLPLELTCTVGKISHEVANYKQMMIGATLSYECTMFTRKDKYKALARNDGTVVEKPQLKPNKVFSMCGKRCVLMANPRVMVEGFLKDLLGVDLVLGMEIGSYKGRETGFVNKPGMLVGKKKVDALKKAFGDSQPEIGFGDRHTDFPVHVFSMCGKRCVLTANPRVMVERCLKIFLRVDLVLGTEIGSYKGRAIGFVNKPRVLVGKKKAFGDIQPEIGLGDRHTDFPFMTLCKE
ncbi:hypothetical protein F0562_033661 [Nyssa sinensis]|uniref:Glycerol-3-phosphate acyltransferase RAM2/GPAT1-8 HAD-like domain-containing protein n=1 Tax=Nyssa sinensis TaxID=561372 RepID=A0A5J5AG32_9ASTE|nr:hypothetical protein F0562_033661 [Nyssa sinensis]